MTTVGIVSALEAEARVLGLRRIPARTVVSLRSGALVCVGGMGKQCAADAARGLIAAGAQALVSFGLAGGLDPRARPGTVLLPERILSTAEAAVHATCTPWRDALAATLAAERLSLLNRGAMLTSALPLLTPGDKAEALARTGALGVDMESHSVAAVAAEAQLPCLIVRVVTDAAEDLLPPVIARHALDGSVPTSMQVLRAVLAQPATLAGTLLLARRYRSARRSLRRIGRSGALWRSLPDAASATAAPVHA